MGLGVRRPVAGGGDLRQLPAPQARPARAAADPRPAGGRLQPAAAAGNRARQPMRLTRRLATGRGRLSLRSRLLAGLLTVTALFLVVMGVVTTVVLGNSEQGQFNSDLVLATRVRLSQLSGLQGFAVAYYDADTRAVTPVPPSSTDLTELQQYLTSVATDQQFRAFRAQNP